MTRHRLTYLSAVRNLVSEGMVNHAKEHPMSTPTLPVEQFVDFARRGQQAVTAAAAATTEAVKSYADAVAVRHPRPLDPQVVTAATFDLAAKLLHAQREYASTS